MIYILGCRVREEGRDRYHAPAVRFVSGGGDGDGDGDGDEDEDGGEGGRSEAGEWARGDGRGIRRGVSSSSTQPPRSPISTTRSRMRVSSSFLCARVRMRVSSGRKTVSGGRDGDGPTYFCRSSSTRASLSSARCASACTRCATSSMRSSTSSRRFEELRDERQVSLRMSPAATVKRKPSARKLAPFSIALGAEGGRV